MTSPKTLTDEQRAERRKADREFAVRAVEALRSTEGWQAWLRVRAAFRTYSVANTCLLAMQLPDATQVAGFKRWLSLGYVPRRGSRALRIWAPVPPSATRLAAWESDGADPAQRPRTWFRLVAVFDRSQVDPLGPPATPAPLDPPIRKLTGEQLAETWAPLVVLAGEIGSSVTVGQVHGSANGYYETPSRRIVISDDLAIDQQVKTLVHELAHALVAADRRDDDPVLDYAAEELVAESVAFTVVRGMGVDCSDYSVPYLASWSQAATANELAGIAGLVDRLAGRIEQTLEHRPLAAG